MKLRALIEPGNPELVATGFQFTEGPIWHPDGFLLFTDIPAGRIYRWTPETGATVWREPSGHANGLTLDRAGRLIACEHGRRRVSRATVANGADGGPEALAEQFAGRRLNSPNDVVVHSSGAIYFTDPPYGIRPDEQEQPHNGVYRLAPGGALALLANDFERPNGLAFAPDEATLYVDDSARRHVRAFDVRPDGTLANGRIIADMDHPRPGVPDGMKVDSAGHLYVTGATGVWVFEPDGTPLGVITTPEGPANCAWGDADRQTLYITAKTSLYRIRTTLPGLAPVAAG
jgi:gluconolactonase